MLADGTAVWMRMRVEAWANADPLTSAVPAAPAATPFSSERRNMQPPFSKQSGPCAVCLDGPASRSCVARLRRRDARDTIGDLRRARHRFDATRANARAGLKRSGRLALAAARAPAHNPKVLLPGKRTHEPVSYTHLTLPTSDLV